MHLVFPCNLSNRLNAHQGFQPDLGLESACIPFPLCFAHSSAVLSCPAEPEKSNLATGPNFGVHFWMLGVVIATGLDKALGLSLSPGEKISPAPFSSEERLAVYTVAALTHDMG